MGEVWKYRNAGVFKPTYSSTPYFQGRSRILKSISYEKRLFPNLIPNLLPVSGRGNSGIAWVPTLPVPLPRSRRDSPTRGEGESEGLGPKNLPLKGEEPGVRGDSPLPPTPFPKALGGG
jgi:hypothetical protein